MCANELRFVEKHPDRAKMLEAKLTGFEAAMRRGSNGPTVWDGRSPVVRVLAAWPFSYRLNRRLGGDAWYS